MVDFNKLLTDEGETSPVDPGELFRILLRDAEYEYLRDVQNEVLDGWMSRRQEKDCVIKMNTGAGKTLVGLLMLQSSLNEGVGPVLYLCPTRQLVEQVVAQAAKYGISTVTFDSDNEMPPDFLNGDAILVCTFQKLFNGKSIFGVAGSPRQYVDLGCVLIDDAHSCISIAQDTVSVTLDNKSAGYGQLVALFRPALEAQSLGTATSILQGDPRYYMAVPHWAWLNAQQNVAAVLSSLRDTDALKFTWDLIKDDLALCHCVIAGHKLEIKPYITPIEKLPSFTKAKRRFFLSATLVDDAVLLREFGVSREAAEKTIRPKVRGDIGQRMILAPRLIDKELVRDQVAGLAKHFSNNKTNVVVLVQSEKQAKYWQQAGATIGMGEDVGPLVARLQTSVGNFVVLVNRYDGIDLPGKACRLLVMDGLPSGISLYEQYLYSVLPSSRQQKGNLAQKVEQGLGRGVRSGSDYCVALLTGTDLVPFITARQNQEFLSSETRRQVEIGQKLAKESHQDTGAATKRLFELMLPCLKQDDAWKRYYLKSMSNLTANAQDETRLKLAVMERAAIERSRAGNAGEAADIIQKALADLGMTAGEDFGWYLQIAAAFAHKTDPARSQEMQRKAHEANTSLFKPIEGIRYRKLTKSGIQANRVLQWANSHTEANAIPIAMSALISKLTFSGNYREYEQGWAEIGRVLGFATQRPEEEYKCGPDVLWNMSDDHFLVCEVKNEVKANRQFIFKDEINQLAGSVNWFTHEYVNVTKFNPVLIHPSNTCNNDATAPPNTLVHTESEATKLHRQLQAFAAALAVKPPDSWTLDEVAQMLGAHNLTPAAFRSHFFIPAKQA